MKLIKKLLFASFLSWILLQTLLISLRFNFFELLIQDQLLRAAQSAEPPQSSPVSRQARTPIHYDMDTISKSRLLFIGGFSHSGSDLVKLILTDLASNSVKFSNYKLNPIHSALEFNRDYKSDQKRMKELKAAGLSKTKLDNAVRVYIYSSIDHEAKYDQKILCVLDPNSLYHMSYLIELFPYAKFIFNVRDLRLILGSSGEMSKKMMSDQIKLWLDFNQKVSDQCERINFLGLNQSELNCLRLKYENLWIDREGTRKIIFKFLKLNTSMTNVSRLKMVKGNERSSLNETVFASFLRETDQNGAQKLLKLMRLFDYK